MGVININADIHRYEFGNGYTGSDIKAIFRLPDELNLKNDEGEDIYKVKPKVFAELETVAFSTYRDKFPVRALGHIKAKDYTRGTRTVGGTLIFKLLDKSIINKMVENLHVTGKSFNILPDELPPFDIDIIFNNELGQTTKMTLVGVHITEGNQVMSSKKLSVDEKYSFVAQDLSVIDSEHLSYENRKDLRNFELEDFDYTDIDTSLSKDYEEQMIENYSKQLDDLKQKIKEKEKEILENKLFDQKTIKQDDELKELKQKAHQTRQKIPALKEGDSIE